MRAALYIIKSYQKQLIFDAASVNPLLKSIWIHMRSHFKDEKDTIGMNVAALERISKTILERSEFSHGFDIEFNNTPFAKWARCFAIVISLFN